MFSHTFLRGENELQEFLLFLLKGGLPKQSRDAVGNAASYYVSQKTARLGLEKTEPNLSEAGRSAVDALQQTGYAVIDPVFSTSEIAEIEDFFKNKKVHYGAIGHDEGGRKGEVLLDDLPEDIRFASYHAADVYACPTIYKAVHSEQLINAMATYLDAPPTIASVSMWWSFPSSQKPGGMQMFHHDRGDFRSCNLFVYLTDVSESTGPHSFVAKTHNFKILHNLAMKRFGGNSESFQRFWQWIEVHRKKDEDVRQAFHEDEIKVFTGPKGKSFLEDTRGLHKATLPVSGPRLAFEIIYSTLPKFNEKISPVPRKNLEFEIDDEAIDPRTRYATRLIYS